MAIGMQHGLRLRSQPVAIGPIAAIGDAGCTALRVQRGSSM